MKKQPWYRRSGVWGAIVTAFVAISSTYVASVDVSQEEIKALAKALATVGAAVGAVASWVGSYYDDRG